MNNQIFKATAFIVLLFALSAACFGEGIRNRKPGDPLPGGEGFPDGVPSWLVVIKVTNGHYTDFGTGAFISDRAILTVHHNFRDTVQRDSRCKMSVICSNGKEYTEVKIVHYDKVPDLGLLLVKDDVVDYHQCIQVADEYESDTAVWTVGFHPGNDRIESFDGKPTSKRYGYDRNTPNVKSLFTARVVQGMSGGPVLDDKGSLIGVISSKMKDKYGREIGSLSPTLERIHGFLDSYDGEHGLVPLVDTPLVPFP